MHGTANGDPESELQEEGSLAGFATLEALLEVHILPRMILPSPCVRQKSICWVQNYIPQDKLVEVKRVLYGANRGAPVQALPLNQRVHEAAASAGFEVQGYKFTARQEQNRQPRTVKIGLIQNSIKAPTTAPYAEQTKVRMYTCSSEGQ